MSYMKRLFAILLLTSPCGLRAGEVVLLSTEPVEPRASQVFDVIYTLEFCGDTFPGNLPQNRIVSEAGGVVRILAPYALQLCGGQPHVPSYRWSIGPLAAGTYRIELLGYDEDPQIPFPIASGEITVAPAVVAPEVNVVPASGLLGLILLSVSAAFAATRALWRR